MNSDKVILTAIAAGVLVVYTVIVFAFFGAKPEDRILYLALLGLPIAVGFFAAPRFSLYALGVLVYSVDWLNEFWMVLPREATWLTDIFLVLFAVRYGATFFTAKHKVYGAEKAIIVVFVFAVLSGLINGEAQSTVLIGIRVAFRYLVLFLALTGLSTTEVHVRSFMRFFLIISLIQIPVILWQWQHWGFTSGDEMYGTFGHNQTPGIALMFMTIYALFIARAIEEKKLRFGHLAILLILVIGPVMGEAKVFFLLLPLLLGFMFRAEFLRRPGLAILFGLVGLIIIFAADYVILQTGFWREGRNPLTYVTKLGEVFQTEVERPQGESYERSYRFVSALHLASRGPREMAIGNGPGSITLSYVADHHSATSEYFAGFGLTSSAATIPWMVTEYGFGGTFLFLLVVYLVFRRGKSLRMSDNIEHRIYGRTLEGMTFLYFAWLFYQSAWQSEQMNYVYWAPAGLIVALSYSVDAARALEQVKRRAEAAKLAPSFPLVSTSVDRSGEN